MVVCIFSLASLLAYFSLASSSSITSFFSSSRQAFGLPSFPSRVLKSEEWDRLLPRLHQVQSYTFAFAKCLCSYFFYQIDKQTGGRYPTKDRPEFWKVARKLFWFCNHGLTRHGGEEKMIGSLLRQRGVGHLLPDSVHL